MSDEIFGGATSGSDDTRYSGTPYECIAFLDSYFNAMREFAKGAGMAERETGGDPSKWDEAAAELDKRAFEVTVRPLRMSARSEFREETMARGTAIKSMLEVLHILFQSPNDEGE